MKQTKNVIKEKKYWNKIIWSNLFFTYALLFLILCCACWKGAFDGDKNKFYANLAFGCFLLIVSFVLILTFTILNVKKNQNILKDSKFIAYLYTTWIPIAGAITSYLYKFKENKLVKNKKAYAPSAYTILFFLTLAIALIIWIIYLTKGVITYEADGETVTGVVPGILDVLMSPLKGFVDAGELIIFLLIIGAFLQIVNASKSIEAGISAIIKKMNGKEIYLIPVLMLCFSIGGTTFGMCEETLPFYLILTPIMLAAGFDALTSLFTILFGAGLGVAGSILNPFLIAPAVTAAGVEGLRTTTGIAWRIITYALLVIVGIACVTYHAYRVKKDPKKSIVYEQFEDHHKHFKIGNTEQYQLTTKRKAILWIFGFTFLLMILMVIDWEGLIPGFTGFTWFNNWLRENLPFIWSGEHGIGGWSLIEMSFLFFTSALIIGIITWKSEEDFLQNIFTGARDFIGVAFIIAIARGLSMMLTSSGVNSILVSGLSNMMNNINAQLGILIIFVIFIILSFLIPSTSGFASTVFPVMGPAIATSTSGLTVSGAITTFSLANGFVNLFSPTAGPFVAGCSLCKVSLNDFYKGAWKTLGIILLTMITLILIGTTVPKLF